MILKTWQGIFVPLIATIVLAFSGAAHADGDEMLGFINVADGSDVIMAGVGLDAGPGAINISIPGGVTIEQVLLYWNGFALSAGEAGETDTITVNGSPVTGDRIGGPDFFFGKAWSSTYRTNLSPSVLSAGPNSVAIGGLDFGQANNGAGLLVIVDDGVNTTDIQVADGDDTAFSGFPPPRDAVVPVTYTFAPAGVDRMAEVSMFLASIEGPTSGSGPCRPNVLRIFVDGILVEEFENPFNSSDGPEWDTFTTPVEIPAGATSVTVEPISDNLGNDCPPSDPDTGLDASFVWVASSFVLQEDNTGACCLPDGTCIDGVTEAECAAEGGEFQGSGTNCGQVDCSGACCLPDGTCIDGVTEAECAAEGGEFQGSGTNCGQVDCSGACCLPDGTCIDGVTEAECAAEGGEFQGSGTNCGQVDCSGACCLPDGTCIDGVTEAECAAEGGEYQGGGTNCGQVDCSGACCLPDGTCIDGVTELECFVEGGEFQGGGTDCSTVDCSGACCIPAGPQGGCIDGLTEAECLAENGEFQGSGTSCDTVECPTCDLAVDVEGCVVIPPPSGADDCDGKVEELTLRYTGQDCSASNNPQGGAAECSGDPNFASPVRIRVSNKENPFDNGAEVYFDGTISLDGELNATAANAGQNDFASNSYVHVLTLSDSVLQTNTVHTSCSKPLAVGNQFGAMLVTRMVTTNGGEVVLPPDEDECITEIVLERMDACDGKVTELLLEYTGEDCSASSNDQDGDVCSGDPSFASPVRIRVSNKENPFDGGAEVYFDDEVMLGETFLATAANAGQNDFASNSWVHVLSPLDAVLQTVSMHTSCSRPLGPGDQFGSIFVAGMTTTNGGTDLFGAEVEYTYTVENTGSSVVENVTVVDSVFGELPGSPIASIDPGETVMLTLVTLISETTTNMVTVQGETAGGLGECDAQAGATVTVVEPPAPPQDCCENGKPRSLTFVYTGEGCSASDNTQSSDECSGDPGFASPVVIEVTDKSNPFDSNPKVFFAGEVALGGSFEATALAVGDDRFPSNTFIHIFSTSGDLLQTNGVHTSCSQPLFVGDQFGAALLTDCVGENEPIPGDCCDAGKPRALRMLYTGEDCSASDNAQSGSDCTGNPNFASPVRVIASDKSNPFDGGARIYFDGEVLLGGTFDMFASNAGENRFESNTYVHVLSLGDDVLQTNQIHTSCSQPLFVGNQFGSVELLDCIGEDDPPGTTFPELGQCMGDLDGDGTRGFSDLSTLLGVWGPCPTPCLADMDVDGSVGFSDLTMLLAVWDEPCN